MDLGCKIKELFKKIFSSHESYYSNEGKGTAKQGDDLTKLNTKNRHDFFNS